MSTLTKKVAISIHSKYSTTVCILTKKVASSIHSKDSIVVCTLTKKVAISIHSKYSTTVCILTKKVASSIHSKHSTTVCILTKKVASYILSTFLLSLYWWKKWQVITVVLYYPLYIDKKSGKSYYYTPICQTYTVGRPSAGQQLLWKQFILSKAH